MHDVLEPGEEKFYISLGRAISVWWILESDLIDIFAEILSCRDKTTSSLIYYSHNSFAARLNIIKQVLNHIFKDSHQICNEWTTIRGKIGKLWEERGGFSHPALYREVIHESDGIEFGPIYISDPPKHPNPKRAGERITSAELDRHVGACHVLDYELKRFFEELKNALASQGKLP